MDIAAFIDRETIRAALESGVPLTILAARGSGKTSIALQIEGKWSPQAARWTAAELEFLEENIGKMTDGEIASALGRSPNAIKIKRIRKGMPAHSKRPGWLTGHGAAKTLGVDIHNIMALHQRGLIPMEVVPGEKGIMNIRKITLYRWALNPKNWIYFKFERVRDLRLKRLLELKRARWNDEWLRPQQVADLLGVDHSDVNRSIHLGRLQGVQWGNWWILRSEVLKPGIYIPKGKGRGVDTISSDEEGAFIVLARAIGYSCGAIAKMTKMSEPQAVSFRLQALCRRGQLDYLIDKYDLGVETRVIDPAKGEFLLWTDWRQHADRFPGLVRAVDKFRRFVAWEYEYPRKWPFVQYGADLLRIRFVLCSWMQWYTETEEQKDLAHRLNYMNHVRPDTLALAYRRMVGWGIDPFGSGGD